MNFEAHPETDIALAIEVIRSEGRASLSLLQRRLRTSYTRAVLIMDELEQRRIVGPAQGVEPREILIETNQQAAERNEVKKIEAERLKESMQANQLPATATEQAIGGRLANPTPKPNPADNGKPKRRKNKKPEAGKSPELPGMPALDPVAKAARRYLKAVDAVTKATENKGECASELLKVMIAAKKESILIEGHRIHWKHVDAKDSLTVEKPK